MTKTTATKENKMTNVAKADMIEASKNPDLERMGLAEALTIIAQTINAPYDYMNFSTGQMEERNGLEYPLRRMIQGVANAANAKVNTTDTYRSGNQDRPSGLRYQLDEERRVAREIMAGAKSLAALSPEQMLAFKNATKAAIETEARITQLEAAEDYAAAALELYCGVTYQRFDSWTMPRSYGKTESTQITEAELAEMEAYAKQLKVS